MIKFWGCAVAAALTMLAAGAAQAMTPAQIVGLCKAEGAFGETFGSAPPPGVRVQFNSVTAKLDGAYPPFDSAELLYSPNSRKLYSVLATARYGSEEEARAALTALVAAAMADGRFTSEAGAVDDGEVRFRSEGAKAVELALLRDGSEVFVGCIQQAGQQLADDEETGRVPLTEKPQPPALALPAPPPGDVCATAVSRAAFLAGFEDRMDETMAYGSEASRYGTQLGQWKSSQLKAKKAWTDAEDEQFNAALLDDPEFAKRFQASLDSLKDFMSDLSAYSEAMDRKDQVGACNAAVRALATVRQMLANNQAQWALIAARYDAVAQKKGVVLD